MNVINHYRRGCGQLRELTRKNFAQLNRLKKQLETHFDTNPGLKSLAVWLKENEAIIGKIRKIDRATAAGKKND